MNLEQIDTSTTAGKAEVMRLAVEGREVAYREHLIGGGWYAHSKWRQPDWDWLHVTYAIIAEQVGPDELFAVVFPTHTGVWVEQHEAGEIASERGGTLVRYIRADLAGEKG